MSETTETKEFNSRKEFEDNVQELYLRLLSEDIEGWISIDLGGLNLKLAFSDDPDRRRDQKTQLRLHLQNFKVTDEGTLLNLQNWARGRGMSYELSVTKPWWTRTGLLTRVLVYLYNHHQVVRDAIRPAKIIK